MKDLIFVDLPSLEKLVFGEYYALKDITTCFWTPSLIIDSRMLCYFLNRPSQVIYHFHGF